MATPRDRQMEQAAETDAIAGIHQGDRAREAALGKKSEWNTNENPKHAKATATMNQRPVVADLSADIEVEEQRIEQAGEPPSFLFVKVLIAAFVEFIGSTLIMTNAGFEVPINVLGGFALAVAIFALVSLTSKTRDHRMYLAIGALVVVSCAVASLRSQEALGEEDDGRVNEWALGIVALIMTVGPALWAEPLLRKLGTLFPHIRRRRRLSVQRAALERDINAAEAFSENHKKAQLEWEDTDHRLKATYDMAFARKRAEIESTDPTR